VQRVAFSLDGKRLASLSSIFDRKVNQGQELILWDAHSGQKLLTFRGGGARFAFSPDGKWLASASLEGKTVKVWDAQTGQELLCFKGLDTTVRSLAFSADGKRLAGGANKGTVWIWDATPLPEKP
jgi:WD40 repeat protein